MQRTSAGRQRLTARLDGACIALLAQVLEKEPHPDGSQRLARRCSLERVTGAAVIGADDW